MVMGWWESLVNFVFGEVPAVEQKFTPADGAIDWVRVETLVHGPGASESGQQSSDLNSAVYACLMTKSLAAIEPQLKVYRRDRKGKTEHLGQHPWQQLLDRPTPNGELSAKEIWFWVNWAKHVDGNAYLRKLRAGNPETGNVVQLWPVSPRLIAPVTEKDSGDWISYYRYQYAPGKYEAIPPGNIVHFRMGIDDRDHRKGLSGLKRLVRAVSTDEEADRFTDDLLHNFAVPGLIVTTQDKTMTRDEAETIKDRVGSNFGQRNRGKVGVLNNGATVAQFGFSPEQMNMMTLHRVPEERIAAVIGIPAILAGLGAGLDSATYSNAKTLRELFTESDLCPLWAMDGEKVTSSMRPDFAASTPDVFCAFDLSDVRALQEDEDAKYKRLNIGVQGTKPWIRVNEARADVGLPPDEELQTNQLAKPAPPVLPTPEKEPDEDEQQDDTQQDGKGILEGKANRHLLAQFPDLLQAMVDLSAPALEKDMAGYFDEQRRRVKRSLMAQEGD